MKLHMGCGSKYLEGWTNIDVAPAAHGKQPDIQAPAWKIPLPDGCADEVMGIHVWEHFYLWECDDVIKEWCRLMRPGASLILEMPDLFKFCQNILDGRPGRLHPDQLGMWGLFGDPRDRNPHMTHKWGWTFKTLAPFLEANGFKDCKEELTQYHTVGKAVRDFRITARRI